jgi:phage baseplate assembly protein W
MAIERNYLGSMWSVVAPVSRYGGMNIVSGQDIVPDAIIALCLTSAGELPMEPEYGLKPELFGLIDEVDPDYWAASVAQSIWRWVPGLVGLKIDMAFDTQNCKVAANILYRSTNELTLNNLSFPYRLYTGSIYYEDIETFREGLSLNGKPFAGIR